MIVGIGIDLVQISRYQRDLLRDDPTQYLTSHFSLREIEIVQARGDDEATLYATRWAAKEALVKALNGPDLHEKKAWTNWADIREIEVLSDTQQRPYLELSGKFKKAADERGVKKIHLSFSHEGDYATAIVVLEG